MPIYKTKDLFDLNETIAASLLKNTIWPWEALDLIQNFILQIGPSLDKNKYIKIEENVWAANSSKIANSASITGPCIIGENTEIRHCAFIRGNALIGNDCVVGNSTEVKNAILFNNVQAPHFNYVGDSILGYKAHLGAGSITSNVKSNKTTVIINGGLETAETGRIKVGSMLGDYAEIGCNTVLCPGSIVGKHSDIYPTSCVRGVVPSNCILKNTGEITTKTY